MHAVILLLVVASQEQLAQERLWTQLKQVRTKLEASKTAALGAPAKNCSIPLLDVRKDKTPVETMPLRKPEGEFYIRQVTPPAPPCENWGK